MAFLRDKTISNRISGKELKYAPKVSETFLEEWLDFPRNIDRWVFANSILLWTNKSIASLHPQNITIRERLSNCISVIGTASGLFLVLAVAAFLVLPIPRADAQYTKLLLDIYGVLMYTCVMCNVMYISLALTGIYPIIQSLRDDIAFDAFEHLKRGLGGYELMYFNVGLQTISFAFLIAGYLLYSFWALMAMLAVFFIGYRVHE